MSLPERNEERIGHAERDRALSRLTDFTGSGHLDLPEFEERSTRIATARTRAELDSVFADLPTEQSEGQDIEKRPSSDVVARRDALKTAGTALSTMGLIFVAGFAGLPLLFLLALFIPAIVWLSGRGPSGFYRQDE